MNYFLFKNTEKKSLLSSSLDSSLNWTLFSVYIVLLKKNPMTQWISNGYQNIFKLEGIVTQ